MIYQVYPRSFMDSNGDGVGDLQGIIDRLDYVASLGVAAIWLSPIFPSPMKDFGYDVADYTDIEPLFGDLATFDRLVEAAHARGLKIVLDYVPNHSSDQHPWFLESRASRDNPRADWYVWRDPAPGGGPPNNWQAVFGGSAWEYAPEREQYYLHSFLPEQPDLNWRNPDVRAAMLDVIRFWMARGVDGLRMDVIFYLFKHPDMPDLPVTDPTGVGRLVGEWATLDHVYDLDYDDAEGFRTSVLREIRAALDAYPDRVGIGETYLMDPVRVAAYYGPDLDGLHLPFNFTLMPLPWQSDAFRQTIQTYYHALPPGAWPNFVLGSHDEHRFATRFGPENARSAAMLLLTLWGTPTWYYGDELGMTDVEIPPALEQDPHGLRVPGLGLGRDPERTPMQWDASPNAGFCAPDVTPWLPLAADYEQVNVAAQEADPDSMLNYFKRLLRLRHDWPVLHDSGAFAFIERVPDHVLAYSRSRAGETVLVAINFSGDEQTLDLRDWGRSAELLLATDGSAHVGVDLGRVRLAAHSGVLLRVHS